MHSRPPPHLTVARIGLPERRRSGIWTGDGDVVEWLKHSFNTDTDHQGGISNMADAGLDLFVATDEAREGALAFTEKRRPDFAPYA